MKTAMTLLVALTMAACGAPQKSSVMTQEERLNEQLRLAEEQQEAAGDDQWDESETVDEESAKFDKDSAEHELKRAALNAVDCPNTFEKSQLGDYKPGKAVVSLIFENSGAVKNVTVDPYSKTNVGDCIQRAMGTVRVEPFRGAEVPMTWEIELGEYKAPEIEPKEK